MREISTFAVFFGVVLYATAFAVGILVAGGDAWLVLSAAAALLAGATALVVWAWQRHDARSLSLPVPEVHPVTGREADREALRELGVGDEWLARLAGGDRFDAVRAMLAPASQAAAPAGDPALVVVVGPPAAARREAHRVAVDLIDGDHPRRMLSVAAGPFRENNLLAARRHGDRPTVVAVECDPADDDSASALELLDAGLVVAVVEGADPDRDLAWLRTLGRVDAVAVDLQPGVGGLLTLLGFGAPIARVDGVSTDALSFAAVICAYLSDRERARGGPGSSA